MIVNLTQHSASSEQEQEGVFNLTGEALAALVACLTVDSLPTKWEIADRCKKIAQLAKRTGADTAMIAGAPWMMSALEEALNSVGIKPLYSFSMRESAEVAQADGSVRKSSVFRHVGFI